MKYYDEKWEYLVRHYGNRCPIAYEKKDDYVQVTDLHHMCHNTKWRRNKYPNFLDSLLNLLPVSNHYHTKHPSYRKISDYQAEKWEKFLQNPIHWKCKLFVTKVLWP